MAKRLDAKARLLWRSDLVLIDGTRLAGIAIVSYANPFVGGNTERDDDAQGNIDEGEADLCLALEMLRNQPLHISAVTTDRGSAPVVSATSQKQSHWIASGEVRVYIDPRETATWSYFQRVFCFDSDFVTDAGNRRSAQVVTVSLQPSLLGSAEDKFASDSFAFSTASHSEYAIFAQPAHASQADEAATSLDSTPIRLVLGRRVTIQTKRTVVNVAGRELGRTRSFHRQPNVGSQTLHDVFSQAGLSLPTFGGVSVVPTSAGPRPDDPLPRGSISALLQARSKRKPAHTQRHRGVSPVAPSTVAPLAPLGTHTPGRRGEKRHSTSDRKVARSPSLESQVKDEHRDTAIVSPTKTIKHRADRILSDLPRLNLGRQPTRALVPKSESRPHLLDVKPVKLESVSPEPFLTDLKPHSASPDPTGSIEKSNRNTIKKLVHTLLVRDYTLSKSHPDYIASYNQTCSGTWCTFRNIASVKLLDKHAVENVVRIHLSLYL